MNIALLLILNFLNNINLQIFIKLNELNTKLHLYWNTTHVCTCAALSECQSNHHDVRMIKKHVLAQAVFWKEMSIYYKCYINSYINSYILNPRGSDILRYALHDKCNKNSSECLPLQYSTQMQNSNSGVSHIFEFQMESR